MHNRVAFLLVVAAALQAGCNARSVGGDPDPVCPVTSYDFDVRFLETELTDMSPMPLAATGDWVFYTSGGTQGTNAPDDPEIFGVDIESEAVTQLTADDRHTVLLGAADGAVLYRESDSLFAEPAQLMLRPVSGPAVDLGSYPVQAVEYGLGWYTPAPSRFLDGGQATWSADGRVYLYDGAQVIEIFDSGNVYSACPYLRDGVVVFSSWDDNDSEIYRYYDGELQRLTDNDSRDELPVTSGGRVFWVCNNAICVWDEQDPQVRVLDEGLCFEPDTDQGQAAWVCDGRVRLFDGDTVRSLGDGDRVQHGVRLRDGKLVWLEIAQEDPPDYYVGEGTLIFSDGQDTWEVAQVWLPCIYCGAYWPPLYLSFTGELIAWTYAIDSDPPEPPFPEDGFGAYTKVVPRTSCD